MKDNVIALLLVLLTSVSVSATAAPYPYTPYTPYTPYSGGYRSMPSQAETGTPAMHSQRRRNQTDGVYPRWRCTEPRAGNGVSGKGYRPVF